MILEMFTGFGLPKNQSITIEELFRGATSEEELQNFISFLKDTPLTVGPSEYLTAYLLKEVFNLKGQLEALQNESN